MTNNFGSVSDWRSCSVLNPVTIFDTYEDKIYQIIYVETMSANIFASNPHTRVNL